MNATIFFIHPRISHQATFPSATSIIGSIAVVIPVPGITSGIITGIPVLMERESARSWLFMKCNPNASGKKMILEVEVGMEFEVGGVAR